MSVLDLLKYAKTKIRKKTYGDVTLSNTDLEIYNQELRKFATMLYELSECVKKINEMCDFIDVCYKFERYTFTREAKEFLDLLEKNKSKTTDLLKELKIVNLFKDLNIEFNKSEEENYLLLFAYVTYNGSQKYRDDIKDLNYIFGKIEKIIMSQELKFENTTKVKIFSSKETDEIFKSMMGTFFEKKAGILKILNDLENAILFVENSPTCKKIFNLYRKRITTDVDLRAINPKLSGKINIKINNCKEEEDSGFERILEYHISCIKKFGSLEYYYFELTRFLKDSMIGIIATGTDLFTRVYGNYITLSINFNISFESHGTAWVGGKRVAEGVNSVATITTFDPYLKCLDIAIAGTPALTEIIANRDMIPFSQTLVHEINHIFDKQLNVLKPDDSYSKIRAEGIAQFGEFAYYFKIPEFLDTKKKKIIQLLMLMTISNEEELYVRDDAIKYPLGEFMCHVIFYSKLKEKMSLMVGFFDYYNDRYLMTNEVSKAVATNLVMQFRSMSDYDFFSYYLECSKKINLKPIINQEFLKNLKK